MSGPVSTLRTQAEDALAEATGRKHRNDPVGRVTGGPAGNARLTAWTGLLLLILFGAELVTLLDVRSLISWHVAIGIVLIPPALLKTATTGWRIVRYYTGNRAYRTAGPPPMILRVLGPLVVATTLGVLGTGLALVLVSPDTARESLAGPVSLLMLHKAAFVVWAAVTGLHTVGRLIPALRLTASRIAVPGLSMRVGVLSGAAVVAVVAGLIGTSLATEWHDTGAVRRHQDRAHTARR